MKPTEDAKMQRYNPTIGNQDYVGEAWATMQADALGEYVCHDEAADLIRTQAARIAELEEEREALSLAICGGEDAPGYAASLNVAVLEEVARSNRLSHIQALETVSRNLRHWREECGKLYSRIATLEAEKREAVMQQLASDGQACEAYAAQRVAEAEVARLREALTLIERLYYIEDKDAGWRASRMNGVAREAQDGNDLGHYRRIFPRAALQPKQED